jgi:hypothetical protein
LIHENTAERLGGVKLKSLFGFLLLSCMIYTQAACAEGLKEDIKSASRETGAAFRQTGQDLGKWGRQTGKEIKAGAKRIGPDMKEAGRELKKSGSEIKRSFKGSGD